MEANHSSTYLQKQLEAPMLWIGVYVALASLTLSLAMVLDFFQGFRTKKLWFPCKYFSLNATSSTLLAVAMKLPVDLTTNMWAVMDRLAKISSLALMSTAMANFMPSLGSMGDKGILINVAALVILIVTVIADVCIQVVQVRSFLPHRVLFPEEALAMSLMLLLLLVLVSSAIMVLSTKRYLEAKYQKLHDVALSKELSDMGVITTDKLTTIVKKYWVMAETSNPQFVVARSVAGTASGVLCLLNALILTEAQIREVVLYKSCSLTTASSYGWSTKWILITQAVGVIVGTIGPTSRWCIALCFRCSSRDSRSLKDEFKVEFYWTQKLMECKGSSLPSQIRHHRCRKLLHKAKGLALDLFARAQIFVVLCNKLVLVVSGSIAIPFITSFQLIKRLKMQMRVDSIATSVDRVPASEDHNVQYVRRFALQLQGETALPDNTLKSICKEVDEVIKTGRKQKPEGLLQLLQKSSHFEGVAEFDSDQVESLYFPEPPNCWSLPLVNLTSIAIALPNVAKDRTNNLVRSVSEGIFYVKLIEKCLYENGGLTNIRKAADIWVGVELCGKWQEMDLAEISLKSTNSKETLQELVDQGQKIVAQFKRDVKDCLMRNPFNWPPGVIAANSMYRISKTLLLALREDSDQTDVGLFDHLCIMIADILAACLTNLTRVITIKCHRNAIEEREESVRQAALLLGQTEDILEFLWQIELPGLDAERAAYVDEWRHVMLLENETPSGEIFCSSSERVGSELDGDRVVINVIEEYFQCAEPRGQTIREVLVPCNDNQTRELTYV